MAINIKNSHSSRSCSAPLLLPIYLAVSLILTATSEAFSQSCTVGMQNINFGNVDVTTGAPVDTTATLLVECEGFVGGGGRLCINIGAGSSGDATSRKMLGPGATTIRYDLYTNAARTIVWGSWQTGYKSPGVQADVNNGTTNFTVYGRLLGSQQTAASGAYSSTFTANPFIQYRNVAGSGNCPTSSASTTSSSFTATVTVLPSCTVATTNLNFGTVGLLLSNIDGTSTVNVTCSSSAPYTVSLSDGNTGTSPTNRKMVNGANNVTYGLYRDAGRSLPWGSTIGTDTLSGTGTGAAQPHTVYGRVPAQTTPPPAIYSDNVIVTVTY